MQVIEVLNILISKQDLINKSELIDDFCKQGFVPVQYVRDGITFEKVKQETANNLDSELLEIAQFVKYPNQYWA